MRIFLLLLLIGVVGFVGFEYSHGRDPRTRLTEVIETIMTGAHPKPAVAAAPPIVKPQANLAASPAASDVLVLSAPPRDGAEGGISRFAPIADYLSEKLGRKVVYKHPGTWGGYQSDMQAGVYDIVFDGPHFVSWRIEKLHHNVLVKLPGDPLIVVGFVRSDNKRAKQIGDLVGQGICAHAPPNLGLLSVQNEFTNPARQPNFMVMEGFGAIYKGVQEGKCVAGIVPKKNLLQKDPAGASTHIVYEHAPFPEQAFTAGPRLSPAEQAKITNALMAPEADAVLATFRKAYAYEGQLLLANNAEYREYATYLRPVQGFYDNAAVVANR